MRKLGFAGLLVAVAMSLVSCSGNSSSSSASSIFTPALVPVTMSVQDAPPATGPAILSFEIQVTSAILQPGNVALLTRPANVELEHLQSEPALLGNLNVPAGTYTSIAATFANPQIVIFNNTGGPISLGNGVAPCAVNTSCKLAPPLTSATIAVSTAPFPITLAANSPLGFLLHFDINSSVSLSSTTPPSVTPTVDLKELVPSTGGVIHQEHLAGTITTVSSPNFTLQPGLGAPTPTNVALPPAYNIATNSNTVYTFNDYVATPCATPGFACLAKGQTVKVTANVLTDGTLLAAQITLFEQNNSPAFEGTVVSVGSGQFQMALMGGQWSPTAAPTTSAAIGVIVTVSVPPSTPFEIDSDGFAIPSTLKFAGIGDLVAGQTVEIQPNGVNPGPVANTLTLTANRVRLDETQVTAHVASTTPGANPPTFVMGTLPPLFSGVSSILVQTIATPPATQFQNVTGVSGLATGDTVSVGGLLFNTGTTPTLLAEKVLKRVQCTAVSAAGTTTLVPCTLPPQ